MSTLTGVNRYLQLKQLENMILHAEEKMQTLMPSIGGDRETQLKEFRILAYVTGRQSGTSERVSKLFNPATDIYVGSSGPEVEAFIRRVQTVNSDPKLKVRYLNLNSKNLKNQITNMRNGELKRVWVDCGGAGLYGRSTVINCIIRNIEKDFDPLNPLYILI